MNKDYKEMSEERAKERAKEMDKLIQNSTEHFERMSNKTATKAEMKSMQRKLEKLTGVRGVDLIKDVNRQIAQNEKKMANDIQCLKLIIAFIRLFDSLKE